MEYYIWLMELCVNLISFINCFYNILHWRYIIFITRPKTWKLNLSYLREPHIIIFLYLLLILIFVFCIQIYGYLWNFVTCIQCVVMKSGYLWCPSPEYNTVLWRTVTLLCSQTRNWLLLSHLGFFPSTHFSASFSCWISLPSLCSLSLHSLPPCDQMF